SASDIVLFYLFFRNLRPPPTPTLFPYTTLFRSLIYPQVAKKCQFGEVFSTDARIKANDMTVLEDDKDFFVQYQGSMTLDEEVLRSEEHTSELQSRFDLVCRLLLEKKKNNKTE